MERLRGKSTDQRTWAWTYDLAQAVSFPTREECRAVCVQAIKHRLHPAKKYPIPEPAESIEKLLIEEMVRG